MNRWLMLGNMAGAGLAVCISVSVGQGQKPFKIISVSDPTITTQTLSVGALKIGVTDNGGGVINSIVLPGVGDIMGHEAKSYGRCGQSSIRSMGHSGVYNPTQAGFNETLGTQGPITVTPNKLTVEPRGVALWRGDGKYDFTAWENVGPDGYPHPNGNTDQDGLDERNLPGKQETEVYSEFDYYGTYENYMGRLGVSTPVMRHYFEYRFIRKPGHALEQFRSGTPVWNPGAAVKNIAVSAPAGIYPGTDKDMNTLNTAWSIRNDLANWSPKFRYVQDLNGKWTVQPRTGAMQGSTSNYSPVFIVAESDDPKKGRALGFYRPNSEINTYSVIGVREPDGAMVYKDDRTKETFFLDTPHRTPKMTWMGFRNIVTGMINRTRLPEGVYETYREEYYLLYGTPAEIMATVQTMEARPNPDK